MNSRKTSLEKLSNNSTAVVRTGPSLNLLQITLRQYSQQESTFVARSTASTGGVYATRFPRRRNGPLRPRFICGCAWAGGGWCRGDGKTGPTRAGTCGVCIWHTCRTQRPRYRRFPSTGRATRSTTTFVSRTWWTWDDLDFRHVDVRSSVPRLRRPIYRQWTWCRWQSRRLANAVAVPVTAVVSIGHGQGVRRRWTERALACHNRCRHGNPQTSLANLSGHLAIRWTRTPEHKTRVRISLSSAHRWSLWLIFFLFRVWRTCGDCPTLSVPLECFFLSALDDRFFVSRRDKH